MVALDHQATPILHSSLDRFPRDRFSLGHRSSCAIRKNSVTDCGMRIQQERQLNPIADEVLALIAVVCPILTGVLYALKQDVVKAVGGYEKVTLQLLARLYRGGDGDCGICFEYAVHEAMRRGDHRVLQRIADAAKLCNVPGKDPKSILFGLEKTGSHASLTCASSVARVAVSR
jgi:hypothetical protein